MVITGYEITKSRVRNDQIGTKCLGYEISCVRNDRNSNIKAIGKYIVPNWHINGR